MVVAADYPFLDILWTMIIFFSWVIWIWMMIVILTDVFRRRDLSGGAKAGWTVFLILLPFLGALVYLVKHSAGMAERNIEMAHDRAVRLDGYAQNASGHQDSGGPATQIEKARALLDNGTIDQAEYDVLKAKALA